MIEVRVDSGYGMLDLALNDVVSSRAPSGALRRGLSTYWIDHAEASVRRAAAQGSAQPFAEGNATYLRLDARDVVAAFDFDADERDAERMSLADFLSLLGEWRACVIEAGGASGADARPIVPVRAARSMGRIKSPEPAKPVL